MALFLAVGYNQWHTSSLRVFGFEQIEILATGSKGEDADVGFDEIEVCKMYFQYHMVCILSITHDWLFLDSKNKL